MTSDEQITDKACPHGSMAPRWENMEDFGVHEKISYYLCDACGARLSIEDAEKAMAVAGEGVRIDESLRKTTEEMLEDEKEGRV
jgi:hypothetical protein